MAPKKEEKVKEKKSEAKGPKVHKNPKTLPGQMSQGRKDRLVRLAARKRKPKTWDLQQRANKTQNGQRARFPKAFFLHYKAEVAHMKQKERNDRKAKLGMKRKAAFLKKVASGWGGWRRHVKIHNRPGMRQIMHSKQELTTKKTWSVRRFALEFGPYPITENLIKYFTAANPDPKGFVERNKTDGIHLNQRIRKYRRGLLRHIYRYRRAFRHPEVIRVGTVGEIKSDKVCMHWINNLLRLKPKEKLGNLMIAYCTKMTRISCLPLQSTKQQVLDLAVAKKRYTKYQEEKWVKRGVAKKELKASRRKAQEDAKMSGKPPKAKKVTAKARRAAKKAASGVKPEVKKEVKKTEAKAAPKVAAKTEVKKADVKKEAPAQEKKTAVTPAAAKKDTKASPEKKTKA